LISCVVPETLNWVSLGVMMELVGPAVSVGTNVGADDGSVIKVLAMMWLWSRVAAARAMPVTV
jgi:hypothetical protein